MSKKIFVYFACFHDSEVIPTIVDAYKTATLPQNVYFGIDFQYTREDIKDDFVDWVKRNPQYNIKYRLTEYTKDNLMSLIGCLLYTSPSPRDKRQSRMPSSA